jgi:hypothetical protein
MTPETPRELIEGEAALQRWVSEGGSSHDPFGLAVRIQAKLERYRDGTEGSKRASMCRARLTDLARLERPR